MNSLKDFKNAAFALTASTSLLLNSNVLANPTYSTTIPSIGNGNRESFNLTTLTSQTISSVAPQVVSEYPDNHIWVNGSWQVNTSQETNTPSIKNGANSTSGEIDNTSDLSGANLAKTYILVGEDIAGKVIGTNDLENARNNGAIIILFSDYGTIEQAVATIRTPANVILATHGSPEGEFEWNSKITGRDEWGLDKDGNWYVASSTIKDESMLSYSNILAVLPKKGVNSLTIASCFGGSVQEDQFLRIVPPGTVVQSLVGPYNIGDGAICSRFTSKLAGASSQEDLLIAGYLSFDAKQYHDDFIAYQNDKKVVYWDSKVTNCSPADFGNPLHALPHIIGIGGGSRIDLSTELSKIQTELHNGIIDRAAWDRAKNSISTKLGKSFYQDQLVDEALCKKVGLYEQIGDIAPILQKINNGIPLGTDADPIKAADEMKIGYALTASYLDQSGELMRLRQEAIKGNHSQPIPTKIDPATFPMALSGHGSGTTNLAGIGDRQRIDLATELLKIGAELRTGTINTAAWESAKDSVSERLAKSLAVLTDEKYYVQLGNIYVAPVIDKIKNGIPLGKDVDPAKAADEIRIGYALTISYLDQSGRLEHSQQASINGTMNRGNHLLLKTTTTNNLIADDQPPRPSSLQPRSSAAMVLQQ